jgi:Na+/H+ antiporter NhaD/arsenite permease-like protein
MFANSADPTAPPTARHTASQKHRRILLYAAVRAEAVGGIAPMMYYAIAVFVVASAFIISERFNQTKVALVGAGLMICLPVMDSPDVFYSQDNGIDWDVIFLMLGMMMIVSILRQTGVFEYVAIWAVKRANG